MSPPPTKAIVLISGNGSNLQALIDASQGTNDSEISLPYLKIIRVITNRKAAYGVTRAAEAGIPTTCHNLLTGKYHKKDEKDPAVIKAAREKYDADLADLVISEQPDIVSDHFIIAPLNSFNIQTFIILRFTFHIPQTLTILTSTRLSVLAGCISSHQHSLTP